MASCVLDAGNPCRHDGVDFDANDVALAALLREFRDGFPIGVDQTEHGHGAPLTMRRYGLRGTPSLVLIDGTGRIRYQSLGRDDDLRVGARITALLGGSTGLRYRGCPQDGGSEIQLSWRAVNRWP